MERLFLGLAIHNHQPVGNYPRIFEQNFRTAYAPMVEALERHPGVRLALHYSGPLLDWLRENHPAFLTRVRRLVERGQVEVMTGGYYEPILVSIPDVDKLGQIDKLSQSVRRDFGGTPRGLWLAERIWEPHLPRVLSTSGVEWTVLDDTHFKQVGLTDRDLFGYYVTEEEGHTVKVFGTSQRLRYSIPFSAPEEVLAYLRAEAADGGTKIAIMGDDGEKFGSWPGTYEHCWEKGWVDRFFGLLEANEAWLWTVPLGEYARQYPAAGRIYLPTASYAEMQEWALPAEASSEFHALLQEFQGAGRQDVLRYLRGGFWRNFLVKYPEINAMHKKMLRVHAKVHRARVRSDGDCGLDDLWQGQCNCPYWHGVFGGIYLTHIRLAIYEHLVRAEAAADAVLQSRPAWQSWELVDFDADSRDELLVDTDRTSLYFDPAEGGCLFEWDLRQPAMNLVAVVTRRPEAYHQQLVDLETRRERAAEAGAQADPAGSQTAETIHAAPRSKESGLDRFLSFDWYRRACLVDHFLGPDVTHGSFTRAAYDERGDFVNQPYAVEVEETDDDVLVRLTRDGHVAAEGPEQPVQVGKVVRLGRSSDRVTVEYTLTNHGDRVVETTFGSEWNLAYPPDGPLVEGVATATGPSGVFDGVSALRYRNQQEGLELGLALAEPGRVWTFAIEAVSQSEGGFERTYQGTGLLLSWPLRLEPGTPRQLSLDWTWR